MTDYVSGSDPLQVGLNQKVINKVKSKLGFQAKSEYYLKLPDKKEIFMVLFCLIAKEKTITGNINEIIKSMSPGERDTLQDCYLKPNGKRKTFVASRELKKLSQTIKYNSQLFSSNCDKFDQNQISFVVNSLKKEANALIRYFESKKAEFGEDQGIKDPGEAILIRYQPAQKQAIIAAYSKNALIQEEEKEEQKKEEKLIKQEIKSEKKEEIKNENIGGQKKIKKENKEEKVIKEQIKQKRMKEQLEGDEQENHEQAQEEEEESKEHVPFFRVLIAFFILLLLIAIADKVGKNPLGEFLQAFMPQNTLFQIIEKLASSFSKLFE